MHRVKTFYQNQSGWKLIGGQKIFRSLKTMRRQFQKCSGDRNYMKELKLIVLKWRRQNTNPDEVKVTQSCPTLCDPRDYTNTVHGSLQARTLEWVAVPFSRGSSQHRD